MIEDEKKKKYSTDNLFKQSNKFDNADSNVDNVAMVEYKESIFKKIIYKIKKCFIKNKHFI